MDTKEFYLDEGTFKVHISHFEPGCPGRTSGDPGDCYEAEDPEVEFDFSVATPNGCTIDFEEFLKIFAREHTKGNEVKALHCIEDETIADILEAAGEYEP